MCDRVSLYERCIAVQLRLENPQTLPHASEIKHSFPQKSPTPPSPKRQQQEHPKPKGNQRFLQNQQENLNIKLLAEQIQTKATTSSLKGVLGASPQLHKNSPSISSVNQNSPHKMVTSPPASSNSSETPTPTNAISPLIIHYQNLNPSSNYYEKNTFNTYQEGLNLYQSWVATNAECVWDEELVQAVRGTYFVGFLVGGFILIGGTPRVMAAIIHAHSRALLNAPPGWIIVVLGELRECEVSVVQRGQFTPLGDALCWAIHRLTKIGAAADQKGIHNSLLMHFPTMAPPDPTLIHAALSDLIRQRKVFHSGKGYGIVQAHTYLPEPASSGVHPGDGNANSPPRLLTTSEALTKAHGTSETEKVGNVNHTAVQTDLADLLAGVWPNSAILTARPPPSPKMVLQRSGSFRGDKQSLTSLLSERDRGPWQAKYKTYEAYDFSDVTIKGGEKGSVISKILRVSQPRRRLASFNAQFPPPEWSDNEVSVIHLHSVATQTRSSRHPGGPETCWMSHTHWAPRSSTLPRKPSKRISSASPVALDTLYRPHSTSPSPIKISYNKVHVSQPQVVGSHRRISSSSPSPCITSTHSSRTTSPSLHSTTTNQHESSASTHGSSSISSYKGTSPKHKSTSPANKNRRNPTSPSHSSSPLHVVHQSPQRSPLRKPPLTSSIHHVSPKDPKRKTLSITSSEAMVGGASSSRREKEEGTLTTKNYSPTRYSSHSSNRSKTRGDKLDGKNSEVNTVPTKMGKSLEDVNKQHHKSGKEMKEGQEIMNKSKRQDRSNLQLDLPSEIHMNNFRKVAASPQKPEGLKNNVLHQNLSCIAKGSLSDLTSKNLGYRDINKCDKRLYAEETGQRTTEMEKESERTKYSIQKTTKQDSEKLLAMPLVEDNKLKLSLKESSNISEGNLKKLEKMQTKSLLTPDNKNKASDKNKIILSPGEEVHSVKTYPSLSELNLTFSSLTAQKILQGVSVNSIDTIVEVNMLAEKRKQPAKEGVTNTDFGFV